MNLTHNNQKQILPYSGITMSSIKNSQVSGFYDHNLNKFILKYNESKLNNKNIIKKDVIKLAAGTLKQEL